MDDEARAKFDDFLKSLQRTALDSAFKDLSQQLGSLDPGQVAAMKNIVRELNQLLEAHMEGGGTASRPHFDRFMRRYGSLFGPDQPASPEELVEYLLGQMAHMESLLRSLSPEVRQELEETLASVFRDDALADELAILASNLQQLRPDGSLGQSFRFDGSEYLGMDEALEVIAQLQKMEELDRQLRTGQERHRLDGVSADLIKELLGEESHRELEELRRMAEVLEAAGYIHRVGSRYELTPKGVRKIGDRALQEIFALIRKERSGGHRTSSNGTAGDILEETKRYQYGDPFNINLHRTLMNAVQRSPGTPVRLAPEDLEVRRRSIAPRWPPC